MSLLYAAYLSLVAMSALAMRAYFRIKFSLSQWKAMSLALGIGAFFFGFWDFLAVERGHWSFDAQKIVGVWIGNQPLEELLFFIIIPFLGLVVYTLFLGRGKNQ